MEAGIRSKSPLHNPNGSRHARPPARVAGHAGRTQCDDRAIAKGMLWILHSGGSGSDRVIRLHRRKCTPLGPQSTASRSRGGDSLGEA